MTDWRNGWAKTNHMSKRDVIYRLEMLLAEGEVNRLADAVTQLVLWDATPHGALKWGTLYQSLREGTATDLDKLHLAVMIDELKAECDRQGKRNKR